jgi:hypothetical protein
LSVDKNVKSTTNGIITTKSQQNLRASYNSSNNNKVNGSALEGERINDRFMLKRVNKSNLNRKVSFFFIIFFIFLKFYFFLKDDPMILDADGNFF